MNDHEGLFPYSDNLITMMFIVANDLTEAQREIYKFSFSKRNECHLFNCWSIEDNVFGIILCAEKLDGKSFTSSERTRQQNE